MIFLKSKAGRRCEVMTGKTDHVGYLLLSRLTSLTRNGQTAQRFESSGGHKDKTLTAWVKVGLLIVLIRGTAGCLPCRNLKTKRRIWI